MSTSIPEDWRARAPAMTARAWSGLGRTLQHADAPRWNQTIGDRVGEAELEALAAFRTEIRTRALESARSPSRALTDWVGALQGRLFLLADLPRGTDPARDFETLPTTSRGDIVSRLEDLVPRDEPLDDAIVYSTSGTTGHPVVVPSHPRAMVKNLAHLEQIAAMHGVALTPAEGEPFAMNVTLQQQTYVFATTMSGWGGAVFAKVNIAEHDWAGGARSRARFVASFAPAFVASEPVTLAELVRLGVPLRPKLVVSSAVQLTPRAAEQLGAALGGVVADLYSMTETGPIAASVPGIEGHAVLLPDIFVEALDPQGMRVPDGERGELTVTGGRNPLLPLIRYRTGDYGSLSTVTLPDGRPARAIVGLEGRAPVSFRSQGGNRFGSVDVARRLRPLATFAQHALLQRGDGSVELRIRPIPGIPIPVDDFEHVLRDLFGRDATVSVKVDPELGRDGGKVVAWQSEL